MKNRRAPAPERIFSENRIIEELRGFLQANQKPLISIVGPTASGKTALSVRLATLFDGEVVNADSRQFYRGMDVGTTKVTTAEAKGVPHHLLDFLDPDQEFPVALFQERAEAVINDILRRGKVPFLVGGSGLFTDAVRKNFIIPRVAPDWELREKLGRKTTEQLLHQLQQTDPQAAVKVEPNNRSRIIRALEVILVSGEKMSAQQRKGTPHWDDFLIAVWTEPETLERRIDTRTENIWHSGFLAEVRQLKANGYHIGSPAMIAHGYREAMLYLEGKLTREEAVSIMARNTRKYAKRQRTWWRNKPEVHWVEPDNS